VPVFDLGMQFGKVKSGNLYSKSRRNPETLLAMAIHYNGYWSLHDMKR